ncbi:hypothetical protein [uncultured Serinicoccus sp.]|uniref:hypothetical protein n=1 Tax=uncultured Serinicoccus sp. TaxID=735514 RepID=UPI00260DDC57|nr:hypothetical protein [uncultured Serinicoccus sp.]
MDVDLTISGLAALVALVSAWFAKASVRQAKRSADAAEAQVVGQRESNIAAAQPYVWADVRADDTQGHWLQLMVGNSGPTVAENVRVVFDPPLPFEDRVDSLTGTALQRMQTGMSSLAPGHNLAWVLGASANLLESETAQVHSVTIEADGPFGPIPTLEYAINLADFRESQDRPAGTLHKLTRAVEGITAELKKRD